MSRIPLRQDLSGIAPRRVSAADATVDPGIFSGASPGQVLGNVVAGLAARAMVIRQDQLEKEQDADRARKVGEYTLDLNAHFDQQEEELRGLDPSERLIRARESVQERMKSIDDVEDDDLADMLRREVLRTGAMFEGRVRTRATNDRLRLTQSMLERSKNMLLNQVETDAMLPEQATAQYAETIEPMRGSIFFDQKADELIEQFSVQARAKYNTVQRGAMDETIALAIDHRLDSEDQQAVDSFVKELVAAGVKDGYVRADQEEKLYRAYIDESVQAQFRRDMDADPAHVLWRLQDDKAYLSESGAVARDAMIRQARAASEGKTKTPQQVQEDLFGRQMYAIYRRDEGVSEQEARALDNELEQAFSAGLLERPAYETLRNRNEREYQSQTAVRVRKEILLAEQGGGEWPSIWTLDELNKRDDGFQALSDQDHDALSRMVLNGQKEVAADEMALQQILAADPSDDEPPFIRESVRSRGFTELAVRVGDAVAFDTFAARNIPVSKAQRDLLDEWFSPGSGQVLRAAETIRRVHQTNPAYATNLIEGSDDPVAMQTMLDRLQGVSIDSPEAQLMLETMNSAQGRAAIGRASGHLNANNTDAEPGRNARNALVDEYPDATRHMMLRDVYDSSYRYWYAQFTVNGMTPDVADASARKKATTELKTRTMEVRLGSDEEQRAHAFPSEMYNIGTTRSPTPEVEVFVSSLEDAEFDTGGIAYPSGGVRVGNTVYVPILNDDASQPQVPTAYLKWDRMNHTSRVIRPDATEYAIADTIMSRSYGRADSTAFHPFAHRRGLPQTIEEYDRNTYGDDARHSGIARAMFAVIVKEWEQDHGRSPETESDFAEIRVILNTWAQELKWSAFGVAGD